MITIVCFSVSFLASFAQNVDIGCCIPWCCSLGRLWNVCGPTLESLQVRAAEEEGATVAVGLFAQPPTTFILVTT